MSTDIETTLRRGLAQAPTPAGLTLDADAVTSLASGAHGRRRAGQALLGGMTSLTVVATVTWAGGWLPSDVQRALPAAPWSACPLASDDTGSTVNLEAVDHAAIAVPRGGTVVAGVARGCADGDRLFLAATQAAPDALPPTLPVQGALEDRPGEDHGTSWTAGLPLDGRDVTAVLAPRGSRDLLVVGPDAVHRSSTAPVHVPGTGLDVFVLQDYWPAGEDLASVRRGPDGLVHTSWSAGVTARTWQGTDAAANQTDTWVGQDRQGQHWVMRDGEVRGPVEASGTPYALVFPTDDAARADAVVVLPSAGGGLTLADGAGEIAAVTPLESREGDTDLHASLVTLEGLTLGGSLPTLVWTPAGSTDPVPVPLRMP